MDVGFPVLGTVAAECAVSVHGNALRVVVEALKAQRRMSVHLWGMQRVVQDCKADGICRAEWR